MSEPDFTVRWFERIDEPKFIEEFSCGCCITVLHEHEKCPQCGKGKVEYRFR
jgi:hypothetical protein